MLQSQIDQMCDAPTETPMMIIVSQPALAMSGKTLPVILPIDGQDKSLSAFDKFTNRKTVWVKL